MVTPTVQQEPALERRLQLTLREVIDRQSQRGYEVESRDTAIRMARGQVRISVETLGDQVVLKNG